MECSIEAWVMLWEHAAKWEVAGDDFLHHYFTSLMAQCQKTLALDLQEAEDYANFQILLETDFEKAMSFANDLVTEVEPGN